MAEKKGVYYKSTFENISEEKRRKILDVAVEEFATKGFESLFSFSACFLVVKEQK